jgi:hypothetical protein
MREASRSAVHLMTGSHYRGRNERTSLCDRRWPIDQEKCIVLSQGTSGYRQLCVSIGLFVMILLTERREKGG